MKCTNCGKELEHHSCTNVPGRQPSPNDTCVCGYCYAVYIFNVDLTLRPMTLAEFTALQKNDPAMVREIFRGAAIAEESKFQLERKKFITKN